ncbi:MAG TPA: DNA topoisomerase I [Gammaproteobacteria bacterium]|nr:DNA topoisomerase I [Gammaproteobacteria bacterium]
MSKTLVIVESPAKGKTIEKYLGKDYTVMGTYGHVRDLVPKEGAVDTEHDFAMKYQSIERNEKHVKAILKALKDADRLLLATDPDREGEAISWHLVKLLEEKNALKGKDVQRVVFHEITKSAIQKAVDNPRDLAMDLVNAQQARRALDYLVGFNLSPLLWKKIRRGLSAGRVQSPALRMIVEREEEIEKFKPREYWTIEAALSHQKQAFSAKLAMLEGEKVKQFTITDSESAQAAKQQLEAAAGQKLTVSVVEKKQRKRNPAPPFTTSTLQQEAVRKLGFSAQRTMRTAQQLYEGVAIDGESVGLITYMRTDSVTLSNDALNNLRAVIGKRYGDSNVPEKPNFYRNKTKNAQEAHEAVRPTDANRLPEQLKANLSSDQFKLYDLIWKRTVASQMIHATLDQVSVEFACGEGNRFRATGSTVREPGFLAVYKEGVDDTKEDNERTLPPMEKGDQVDVEAITADQHFTEPPPRYTEATLVKSLEERGIGRPSTYASIISTLQNREYVEMDARRFFPTEVGRVVNRFLSKHFEQYVDYDFTAHLEDELDEVSRGEKNWVPVMQAFWEPFKSQVEDKEHNVSRDEAMQARVLGDDPKTGKPVSVRMGRYGPFAQIGTKEDEDKPLFAGLRAGQKMDSITLEEALELFKLPRHLGESPQGEKISVNIGRFGPYVRYDDKYASIKDDDPYTMTLERAVELVEEKKIADAKKLIKVFDDEGIKILEGRWGPYITDGNKNAKIPKEWKEKPKDISLEQAQQWLAEAPEKKARGRGKAASKSTTKRKKSTSAKGATRKKAAAETNSSSTGH